MESVALQSVCYHSLGAIDSFYMRINIQARKVFRGAHFFELGFKARILLDLINSYRIMVRR